MATALRAAPLHQWTLFIDAEGHSGPENMAVDESLLHAADRSGAGEVFDHRLQGAAADPPAVGGEGEDEAGGVGEGAREVGGQAIAGHDVEADAGEERDPGAAGVVAAPAEDRLEDGHLAGDI